MQLKEKKFKSFFYLTHLSGSVGHIEIELMLIEFVYTRMSYKLVQWSLVPLTQYIFTVPMNPFQKLLLHAFVKRNTFSVVECERNYTDRA